MKSNRTKRPSFIHRWLRRLAILGVVLVSLLFLHWWNGPIRPLVFCASEIHDYSETHGFTGDFVWCITARCSPDVFHRYARQQRLLPLDGDRLPDDCPGWRSYPVFWWTPPVGYSGTYYDFQPGGHRRILAYAEGVLYYDICAW